MDTRKNELYVYSTFCTAGGAGAIYGYDGYQCCCDMGALGVVRKSDAEEEMVRFSWRTTKYEFMTDSAGLGKWRGAPGIWWEAVNEGADCVIIGGSCAGWPVPAQGQQGGYPTPLSECYFLRGNERIESKNPHRIHNVKAGDVVVSLGSGGAGVRPPEERDPEAIRMDVKNELVSVKVATDIYKVVLDSDTLAIDYDATQSLRGKYDEIRSAPGCSGCLVI